jgi:hypothetical protein
VTSPRTYLRTALLTAVVAVLVLVAVALLVLGSPDDEPVRGLPPVSHTG